MSDNDNKVTISDIHDIVTGKAILIGIDNPFEEGRPWYVKQPEDWLLDMAYSTQSAAIALIRKQPEIKKAAKLPPTAGWISQNDRVRRDTKARIADLEKKGEAITPLESIELLKCKSLLDRLVDPAEFTLADELVSGYARKRFEAWLLPQLVVGPDGDNYTDPDTKIGRERWKGLDETQVLVLRAAFYRALDLDDTAKN